MTGRVFANTAKHISFWMICGFVNMAAFDAHATTVNYTLDNVILVGGAQITGTFDWTFSDGDFEGGSGAFTALEIPYTIYSFADGNLNMEIQSDAIEISGNGNYHDIGLDITLRLLQPLSPTQSVPIDPDPTESFFECCGNGFKDQRFLSGNIIPSTVLAGDYNGDGIVDGTDYTVWRDLLGQAVSLPNETVTIGMVSPEDYTVWADNFGVTPGSGSGANSAVPEPSGLAILILGIVLLASVSRNRR